MAIDSYIIRCHTPELLHFSEALARLVLMRTGKAVTFVDDINITLDDFEIGDHNPVSLDKFLADRFKCPFVQISRIFNERGEATSILASIPTYLPPDMCIIDTDTVTGNAIRTACMMLNCDNFSIPIWVRENEDLIDVEDLVFKNSLMEGNKVCNYMYSPEFFSRRTSIPEIYYDEVKRLIDGFI